MWPKIEKYFSRQSSHEKMTSVRYHREWPNGEYRERSSMNWPEEDKTPVVQCEDGDISDQFRTFKVDFSGGLTFAESGAAYNTLLCRSDLCAAEVLTTPGPETEKVRSKTPLFREARLSGPSG